jgi:hypothetical protein
MPTLIRLFIFLLVIAGLVFGSMVALTLFVDPGQKQIVIKIPTRDLVAPQQNASDPLGINALPDPVGVVSKESSEEFVPDEDTPSSEGGGSIKTVSPPPE